jgi:hypothetical protein
MWRIVDALTTEVSWMPMPRAVELELVMGPDDWHIHLGLYAELSPKESRLIIASD